jgi:probable rRNA maturation factor|tara:strand:- start:1409 stop:1858 length:450 start_codon:yes stop_codon:yes gene_type:complete
VGLEISHNNDLAIGKELMDKLNKAYEAISDEENLSDNTINIRIVNDKEMVDLNKQFRRKNSSTNVLSFINHDISKSMTGDLGDIAINYDFIKRESKEQGKTFDDHIIHMLIHGIYHILGLDHKNDEMAKAMEQKEVALLNKLNIRNPYN